MCVSEEQKVRRLDTKAKRIELILAIKMMESLRDTPFPSSTRSGFSNPFARAAIPFDHALHDTCDVLDSRNPEGRCAQCAPPPHKQENHNPETILPAVVQCTPVPLITDILRRRELTIPLSPRRLQPAPPFGPFFRVRASCERWRLLHLPR